MSESFRGEMHAKLEQEQTQRQADIDLIFLSVMESDSHKREHPKKESREQEIRAAEMRLMLPLVRQEGIEVHDPRFEWDYIVLDRPPETAGKRSARIIMEYGIDAKDRIRELYEERTNTLNGELIVRYTLLKTYYQAPEKLREPIWHPDNEEKQVTETLVPSKEIILKASQKVLDTLIAERETQTRLAKEQEDRFQAFMKHLEQYRKKMPLKITLEDMQLNPYLPLYQGLKQFVPTSFFEKNTGPAYAFRIKSEKDYFILEVYYKASGLTKEIYALA